MTEGSFDVAAWEVGEISVRHVSGVIILLDEEGRPVSAAFSYRHGDKALDVPGEGPEAQWLREFGMGDAYEMVREAFDVHRASLQRMN